MNELIELNEDFECDEIVGSIECILEFSNDADLVDEMKTTIAVELLRKIKPLAINHIESIIERMQAFIELQKTQILNGSYIDNKFLNYASKNF